MARCLLALVLMAVVGPTWSQTTSAKPAPRFGGAVQFELATGGDEIESASKVNLGQGGTISVGGFFRPVQGSLFEIQTFLGYKWGMFVPIAAPGADPDVGRGVFQLLANYRNNDKWYVGGGLVVHLDPKYVSKLPSTPDVKFDTAAGALVEAGWSWIGVQCTYVKYHTNGFGTFDASNCGVRVTWRFRKWHPT